MSRIMSTAMRLLRAAGALLILVALTVGLPIALVRFGAAFLPDHIPTLAEITSALSTRDSGEVFLGCLVVSGFVAWAVFSYSLILEIASLTRRRPVRGPRGLGWTRTLAASLLAAALFSSTGTTIAVAQAAPLSTLLNTDAQTSSPVAGSGAGRSHASPPYTTIGHTTATAEPPRTEPATGSTTPTADLRSPTYVVQPGDSLWSIAEHRLGDPERWNEIFTSNRDRPQPDGGMMTDPAIVRPGWILTLPTTTDDAAAAATTYTVTTGDSLSSIAEREQGDASRWPQLFDANNGHPQSDGRSLTDPDLIQPGWTLTLPPTHSDTAPAEPLPGDARPEVPAPPPSLAPPAAPPTSAPATSTPQATATPTPAPATTEPAPATTSSPAKTPAVPAAAATPKPAQPAVGEDSSTVSALAIGISSLAAAGLLAVLAARRYLSSRSRRPGHRMANSAAFGTAETTLRTTEEPDTVELLDLALRTLTAHAGETQQPLPTVLAATISHEFISLRIAEPTEALPPFTNSTDVDWHLDPRATLLDPYDAADIPAPYPALATLGRTPQGDLILVDLEAAGAITLTGDHDDIETVLTALAIELAVSGWADHLNVTLVGFAVRLAELLPDRLRYAATLDDALKDFTRRANQSRQALHGIADSATDARGRGIAADAWIPSIILTADPVSDHQQNQIRQLIETDPRSSLAAVIAADDGAHKLPGPWQIRVPADPSAALPLPVLGGAAVVLQRCGADAYRAVIDDLTQAGSSDQVPAAGYTGVLTEPANLPRHPAGDDDHASDDAIDEFERALGLHEDLPSPRPPSQATTTQDIREAAEPIVDEIVAASDPSAAPAGAADSRSSAGDSDDDLHPMLRLLGPISIDGVDPSLVADNKRNRLIELAAYLVLHPGRDGEEISHALGGSRPWAAPTRQSQMSRLRNWLGTAPDGDPYVAPVTERTGYRLSDAMRCDWISFQRLARRGLSTADPDLLVLDRALRLVTGQPLSGAPTGRYNWADLVRHEMHAAITDVAHTLGLVYLQRGKLDEARAALGRGLLADPVSELLYRDLCRVEYQAGNLAAIATIADRIRRVCDDLDLDPEPETAQLLAAMLDPRRRAADASGEQEMPSMDESATARP